MQTVTYFSLAMILTMALIPSLIFISKRFQIVDLPNQRKVHERNVSRLGGIAMFLSVLISLAYHFYATKSFSIDYFWKIIVVGSCMSFALGLWDDIQDISPKKKLLFQFVIAVTVYFLGFQIKEVQMGFDNPLHLGHFSGIVTVLWIITVMNAINMIDGLDGLAGGFAFLVFMTIATLGYLNESFNVMMLALMYAGACFGFLIFNFHPAKIFMGDAGSMTIGFILSVLALSTGQRTMPVSIFTPLFLLAFPLIDLLTAVLRRMILAKSMNKDISWISLVQKTFNADGNHIHHRLLKLGVSQRRIALVIYAFTVLNCFMGVASAYLPFSIIFFLFIFYGWFTVQSIRLLDYEEFVTSTFRNQKKQFEEKQKLSTAPKLVKRVT